MRILPGIIFLFLCPSMQALTTLQVTLDTDNNPGGFGQIGDLRYCLNTMNQLLNTSPDDIAITFAYPMTIQLNGILPIINTSPAIVNITIGNSGPIPTVTIDGNSGAYPGFFTPMGNVTIQNIIFQNLTAKGGNGGDGISGGGGGLGAGAALFIPQTFLYGYYPSITLMNVQMNNCAAVGGNGGNYATIGLSGDEGGGGGGGLAGNGGSITISGSCGGAGGGGFGGDGGNVTLSTADPAGGGGGGGGGIGARANMGTILNSGNGGSDNQAGQPGNGFGLNAAGSGGGGLAGGINAGGGGGGGPTTLGGSCGGGGGGGNAGMNGMQPLGTIPPGGSAAPSGGNGADGAGGGGGGIVTLNPFANSIDGAAGNGGYGGGGGGGAGTGGYDINYTVQGGAGGFGGGGGGGGVNQSGSTPADGGNSLGGGGGAGGGPSNGLNALGGTDLGNLGGGAGGFGADTVGASFGGGGGGGGSALGAALFIDGGLNVTIQAMSGVPTVFNTANNTVQAGLGGIGGDGALNGLDGSALGTSIFLRSGSSITLLATDPSDLLTLGDQVSFVDDTDFGAGGTSIMVSGNGTVIYNGTSDYKGHIQINNATFKVTGSIANTSVSVCRDIGFTPQRGTLSGSGSLTGNVLVNSGTIWPDAQQTLTLGSLTLNPAQPDFSTLGSLVHSTIDASSTASLVAVQGAATLAGILEIDIAPTALPGHYILLTAAGITGTFDSITFSGPTPDYTLSYLPADNPTYVQLDFLGFPSPAPNPPTDLRGVQRANDFGTLYELYNTLLWQKSSSENVDGYYIYRDTQLIATVSVQTTSYQDHNRPQGVATEYGVAAFNAQGTSDQVTVIVG